MTSHIDKRDPITNAPLPPDNFIACDKHKNRRRGKFLIGKHLPPPTVEVLRVVLQRTSADRKTIPTLLGTPMSITARAAVHLRAYQRIYFNPQRIGTNAEFQEALRNKGSYWVRQSFEEGDGERPQPQTNAAF